MKTRYFNCISICWEPNTNAILHSGYRVDRHRLPHDRQFIASFQRRHKTGQKRGGAHKTSFGRTTQHKHVRLGVNAIGRKHLIVALPKIVAQVVHLKRAFLQPQMCSIIVYQRNYAFISSIDKSKALLQLHSACFYVVSFYFKNKCLSSYLT